MKSFFDSTKCTVLLILSVILTLLPGAWWWLVIPGWVLLLVVCFLNMNYGIYAVFFFASFFHPTGLFPSLFFSLKHYQIAVLLLMLVQSVKGELVRTVLEGFKRSFALYPVLGILLVALLSGIYHKIPMAAFEMTANFALVVLSVVYLAGVVAGRERTVVCGLIYFLIGVAVQVLVDFYNLKTNSFIFNLDLLYNNQFGTLTVLGLFYAVALALVLKHKNLRRLLVMLSLLILLALIFTCSRTSWYAFIVASILFVAMIARYAPRKKLKKIYLIKLGLAGLVLAGIVLVTMLLSVDISQRMTHLYQIFDLSYWKYTIQDHQNFGFLGILRLNQLRAIWQLMQDHFFFGAGFIKQVTDFHGFYFTLVGASGLTGCVLFVIFFWTVSRNLAKSIIRCPSPRGFLLRVSILCALVAWFLSSITQTMFIQYSVWLNVLAAIVLSQDDLRPGPKDY